MRGSMIGLIAGRAGRRRGLANAVAIFVKMDAVARTKLREQAACMTREASLIFVDGREIAVEQVVVRDAGKVARD